MHRSSSNTDLLIPVLKTVSINTLGRYLSFSFFSPGAIVFGKRNKVLWQHHRFFATLTTLQNFNCELIQIFTPGVKYRLISQYCGIMMRIVL